MQVVLVIVVCNLSIIKTHEVRVQKEFVFVKMKLNAVVASSSE